MRMMARTGKIPTNSQLNEMEEQIDSESPEFYRFITDVNYALSRQEILACMFTKLGFSTTEIAGLMNVSKQRVTNMKSKACLKLYGMKSAKILSEKLASV